MPDFNPTQPRDDRGRWTHSLIASLENQLLAKGHKGAEAHALAIEILQKQGSLDKNGVITDHGMERQSMGKAGRAKDRAAKQLGRDPSEIAYNPRTKRTEVKT